jgi:hypothetical protein
MRPGRLLEFCFMKNCITVAKLMTWKKMLFTAVLLFSGVVVFSQEKYGKTVNLGVGIGGYSGYYRYIGVYLPVAHADVEFDIAKNFTLAPFVNVYSYSNRYYLNNPYREYIYRVSVIPVGVKGSYYFDALLGAGSKWDFYGAASVGFAFVRTHWSDYYYVDNGFYRGYYYNHGSGPYLDVHIGAEYHLNEKAGLYLDLSNGLSTLGLAIHR